MAKRKKMGWDELDSLGYIGIIDDEDSDDSSSLGNTADSIGDFADLLMKVLPAVQMLSGRGSDMSDFGEIDRMTPTRSKGKGGGLGSLSEMFR